MGAGRTDRGQRSRFEDKELGKVVPYGVYDIGANLGYVSLGMTTTPGSSPSTPSDAGSIRWLEALSRDEAPDDHGRRRRLQWFTAAALEVGPPTTRGRNRSDHSGCHYPPGTRSGTRSSIACSATSRRDWRATPLLSLLIVIELIANTTTKTGLKPRELDSNTYPKGIKVSDAEMATLNMTRTHSIQNGTTASRRGFTKRIRSEAGSIGSELSPTISSID